MSRHVVTNRLQLLHEAYSRIPVVLFQAPAGCGKTRAAEWWAARLDKPVLWLPLAQAPDLHLQWTFLQGLIERASTLTGQSPIAGQLTTGACLQYLRQVFPAGATLIGDDWHLAAEPDMARTLIDLAEACDDRLTLLVTTRVALEMPQVADWQVRQHALLITDEDLRLESHDAAVMLGIPTDLAAVAHQRSNGWPFALITLEGAIRRGMPPERWQLGDAVATFWRQQILGQYPPALVSFVQATAVMESFTVADCEALGLSDADAHLLKLQADQLFLQHRGNRYAYHDLARQAVMAGLGPARLRLLCLQAGRILWQHRDQGCLPLLLAAEAHDEVARAVAWFSISVWREPFGESTVLHYWTDRLDATKLQHDPWYQILYVWQHHAQKPVDTLTAIAEAAGTRFRANGDMPGEIAVLLTCAGNYMVQGDLANWHHTARQLEHALSRGDVPPEWQLTTINAMLRYAGSALSRPDRVDHWLRQALRHPPVTPAAIALLYQTHLAAMTAYLKFGETDSAWECWHRMIDMLSQVPGWEYPALGYETCLRMQRDEPSAPSLPTPPQADLPPALADLLRFETTEAAYRRREPSAEAGYEYVIGRADQIKSLAPWIYQTCWARLSLLRLRRGAIDAALSACAEGARHEGSLYTDCLLAWHEALILQQAGRTAEAAQRAAQALDSADRHYFIRLWGMSRLLWAQIHGASPPPEVLDLITLWGYGPGLQQHFPELVQAAGPPPRVAVRTLGGLHVTVDGQPVSWKRSNCQLLLLDLLIHPDGSSRDDLLRRYWPNGDVTTLHKDINVLRQILEPGQSGRNSRYVTYRQGIYRLTDDPSLIWWDVPAMKTLLRHGSRARRTPARRVAFDHLMASYQGDFAPEWTAYPPIAAYQADLQALQRRTIPADQGPAGTDRLQ
jgi:tetratricopeptide (TPR) repeat protein/DNA-binding winged helix-turn-helix (wHTH) protein